MRSLLQLSCSSYKFVPTPGFSWGWLAPRWLGNPPSLEAARWQCASASFLSPVLCRYASGSCSGESPRYGFAIHRYGRVEHETWRGTAECCCRREIFHVSWSDLPPGASLYCVIQLLPSAELQLLGKGRACTWARCLHAAWKKSACRDIKRLWNSVPPVQQDASPAGLWREAERFFKSHNFVLSRFTAKLRRGRKEIKFFGSFRNSLVHPSPEKLTSSWQWVARNSWCFLLQYMLREK